MATGKFKFWVRMGRRLVPGIKTQSTSIANKERVVVQGRKMVVLRKSHAHIRVEVRLTGICRQEMSFLSCASTQELNPLEQLQQSVGLMVNFALVSEAPGMTIIGVLLKILPISVMLASEHSRVGGDIAILVKSTLSTSVLCGLSN